MPSVTPSILLKTQVVKPMAALVTVVWAVWPIHRQHKCSNREGRSSGAAPSNTARNKILQSGKNQQPEVGSRGWLQKGPKKPGWGVLTETLCICYNGSQPQAFEKLTKLYLESWWICKSHAHGWNLYIFVKQTGKKWWARFTNHIAIYFSQMKSRKQQGLIG